MKLSRAADFPLPEDYKFFLNNFIEYDCFMGPQFFRLWDADTLLEDNTGYFIFKDLTHILGIGGDGAGECIGLEYLGPGSYHIVLFPFIGMFEKRISH